MGFRESNRIQLGYACHKKARVVDELGRKGSNSFNEQLRDWEEFRNACQQRAELKSKLEERRWPDPTKKNLVDTSKFLEEYGDMYGADYKPKPKKKSHKKSES